MKKSSHTNWQNYKGGIAWEDLERHFSAPKNTGFNCKRVPRKFKKQHKEFLDKTRFDTLTLNQRLWHLLGYINPDYKRFLIKQITK